MKILDSLYHAYNKRAIDEGLKYLKSLPVKKFIKAYLQTLAKKHDKFNIIKENSEYADILSWRDNKKILFRYHKCLIVFYEYYEDFITLFEKQAPDKAFYITCGNFEEKIFKNCKMGRMMGIYNVHLIDGFHCVRRFLGIRRKWTTIWDKQDFFDTYTP